MRKQMSIYNQRTILIAITFVIFLSLQPNSNAYSSDSTKSITYNSGSPISIYKDTFSPSSLVHISIYAPDFNSNQYAIDTIGDEGSGAKITISTRGSSILYRLVETGPDTGVFSGYVILSGTTSTCSPICGPTDGYLSATGDDAITVSLTYEGGSTITNTSSFGTQEIVTNHKPIPEFGPITAGIISASMICMIIFSRRFVKN